MESGISFPVPVVVGGQVKLKYLLYWSQLSGEQQIIHEPFARISVSYPQGLVEEHNPIPTQVPAREIGLFPYPEIADHSPQERRKLWSELNDLYPGVIAAYADLPTQSSKEAVARFAEIYSVVIPPYLKEAYQELNPKFFAWLTGVR